MTKISVFTIVHNEEEVIERCLRSVSEIADEILVFHDGECQDQTLEIAKRFTKNVFTLSYKGRASLHMITAFKKAKNDWLLKIDADEYLSTELKDNIRRLAQNPFADAYSFRWLLWDGKRYATRNYSHKKALFRKSRISFLQFPGWDEPSTYPENTIKTNYLLHHKPKYGVNEAFLSWKKLWARSIRRGKDQAKYTLKDFNEIEKFQYYKKEFPLNIRIRRSFPLLSAPIFSIVALFKGIFSDGAWREGTIILKGAIETSLFYLWLGREIYRLKCKQE